MAPNISPNKTVEGLIGGILASLISVVLVTFGYSALMSYLGEPVSINYLSLTGASVLATFVGVFGDLTASIMKRQNGIKGLWIDYAGTRRGCRPVRLSFLCCAIFLCVAAFFCNLTYDRQ